MTEISLSVSVPRADRGDSLLHEAGLIPDRLEVVRSEIRMLENEIEVLDAICRFWRDMEEPSQTVRPVPSCL
jgi:hypothetical protein